ncbi:MAG: MBL fold metallo-hydrolase [Bacteroidetes bacterium]|nr:MBL fold metallo-hydrolase [Bacteroidota bacterium]
MKTVPITLTTPSGAERLGGATTALTPFQTYTLGTVKITATPATHGPAGTQHITGEVSGFIVESDGVLLYITGDTVFYEGISEAAARFKPAYVFAFAGAARPRGPFNITMSTNDVLDTAHVFPDATIIPLHFEGWSHYTETGEDLQNSFSAAGISDRLKFLEPGKPTAL